MPRRLESRKYQERLSEFVIEEVVKTAIDLFVQKGYESTTMAEIAEKVNISKGSLYNFIGSKENLIYLVTDFVEQKYKTAFKNIDDAVNGLSSTDILRSYINAYIDVVNEMQNAYISISHLVVKLGKEGRRKLFADSLRVQGDIEQVLIRGVKTGEFRIVDTRLAALNIAHLLGEWAGSRWQLRKIMNLSQFKEEMTDFILMAVGAGLEPTYLKPGLELKQKETLTV